MIGKTYYACLSWTIEDETMNVVNSDCRSSLNFKPVMMLSCDGQLLII